MNEKHNFPRLQSLYFPSRRWAWPAVLLLTCASVEALGDAGRQSLRFDRTDLATGELWRLVSGHVTHLSISHMLLNLLSFIILKILFEDLFRGIQWLIVTVFTIAAIDIGLYFGSPDVIWYVGLSGFLHGMAAAGALALARTQQFGWVLAALIALKLVYEQTLGPLPLSTTASGGAVVVDAHLWGSIGGLAGWLVADLFPRHFVRSV